MAVTTLGVTVRSFHRTLPWPAPSVCNTLPSGSVSTTTRGDFSPGAIPEPFGRLAAMDVTGVLSRYTFIPSRTFIGVHPLSASWQAIHRHAAQLVRSGCGTRILANLSSECRFRVNTGLGATIPTISKIGKLLMIGLREALWNVQMPSSLNTKAIEILCDNRH